MGILIFVVCAVVVINAIFGLVVARFVTIQANAEKHIIRDDSIAESIACANVQELFVAHERSSESLKRFLDVTECTPTPDFYDTWIDLTKKRAAFWKSHNLWPLVGVYWMFTRHFKMRDKNIDLQLRKNWIKRPR